MCFVFVILISSECVNWLIFSDISKIQRKTQKTGEIDLNIWINLTFWPILKRNPGVIL